MTRTFRPLIALFLVLPGTAWAAGIQDLNALERRLVISLGADVGQPGGPRAPLDRRMKLAACPDTVEIEPPALGAVALRCAPLGWRIRVPLLAGGPARAVAMAAVMPAPKPEPVVQRGDPIELAVATGGFRVTREMIADESGAPGDHIRVRADRKSAPILVEVIDAGHARLPGFK
ncbi:MAG TPA: flagella basal body P-ring formation protein FlgA [Sphingomonadaceae bacterium]|nr:flagella basal body P-ring formation protein FlgA [Sphingomonadaceae bacterium]